MILEKTYYISSREPTAKSPSPAETVNSIHALAALPLPRNIRAMSHLHSSPHLHITAALAAHTGQQVAALSAYHKAPLIFLIWHLIFRRQVRNILIHIFKSLCLPRVPEEAFFANSCILFHTLFHSNMKHTACWNSKFQSLFSNLNIWELFYANLICLFKGILSMHFFCYNLTLHFFDFSV